MQLSGIELLNDTHRVEAFDCRKPALNAWLVGFARTNQARDFTRVLIVHDAGSVVGYYGLAPGVIRPPDPIPCLLIGQLAVDRNYTGHGIGSALVKDALQRCVRGADTVGGRAVVVRAIDVDAELYWKGWGFTPSRDNPSMLLRSMQDVRHWLDAINRSGGEKGQS